MLKTVRPLKLFAVALFAFALVASQAGHVALAGGNGKHWVAPLSGSQEVPPVDTNATGVAKFKLSKDGDSISYKLNVANIDNVTQAHIHLGQAGTNGGVVAFLFGPVFPDGVTVNGTLVEGVLTAADLRGALVGATIADLIDELESGNAYVNVHTVANPPGEIRGQIK